MCDLQQLDWSEHSSSVLGFVSSLLQKKQFSDATIACDGHLYPVHRFVLSVGSSYFDTIFQSTNTEKHHPVLILQDISQDIFEALLKYMYLGHVSIDHETLSDFLRIAKSLKINGLDVPATLHGSENTLPIEGQGSNVEQNDSKCHCSSNQNSLLDPNFEVSATPFTAQENCLISDAPQQDSTSAKRGTGRAKRGRPLGSLGKKNKGQENDSNFEVSATPFTAQEMCLISEALQQDSTSAKRGTGRAKRGRPLGSSFRQNRMREEDTNFEVNTNPFPAQEVCSNSNGLQHDLVSGKRGTGKAKRGRPLGSLGKKNKGQENDSNFEVSATPFTAQENCLISDAPQQDSISAKGGTGKAKRGRPLGSLGKKSKGQENDSNFEVSATPFTAQENCLISDDPQQDSISAKGGTGRAKRGRPLGSSSKQNRMWREDSNFEVNTTLFTAQEVCSNTNGLQHDLVSAKQVTGKAERGRPLGSLGKRNRTQEEESIEGFPSAKRVLKDHSTKPSPIPNSGCATASPEKIIPSSSGLSVSSMAPVKWEIINDPLQPHPKEDFLPMAAELSKDSSSSMQIPACHQQPTLDPKSVAGSPSSSLRSFRLTDRTAEANQLQHSSSSQSTDIRPAPGEDHHDTTNPPIIRIIPTEKLMASPKTKLQEINNLPPELLVCSSSSSPRTQVQPSQHGEQSLGRSLDTNKLTPCSPIKLCSVKITPLSPNQIGSVNDECNSQIFVRNKTYVCSKCNFITTSQNNLLMHTKNFCSSEGQPASSLSATSSGSNENHSDPGKRINICTICRLEFVRVSCMLQHQASHSVSKPYLKCPDCDYITTSTTSLEKHKMQPKHNVLKRCKHCKFTACTAQALNNHIIGVFDLNEEENPASSEHVLDPSKTNLYLSCNSCSRQFPSHYLYMRHKSQTGHDEEATSYSCNSCEFRSSSQVIVARHIRQHGSNTKIACKLCFYFCDYKSDLNKHILAEHKTTDPESGFQSIDSPAKSNQVLEEANTGSQPVESTSNASDSSFNVNEFQECLDKLLADETEELPSKRKRKVNKKYL